jgi:hypothetical protein
MKIVNFIFCLFLFPTLILASVSEKSQNVDRSDSTMSASHSTTVVSTDSVHSTTEIKIDSGLVLITVSPQEASDATIRLVQKTKMEITPHVINSTPIPFDTIGSWNAPLSMQISLGNYTMLLHKGGFRDVLLEHRFNKVRDSMSIEMYSFQFLEHRRAQWSTVKWISAAIAVGSGLASYYFNDRINHYSSVYNNATVSSDIEAARENIHDHQRNYKVSTTISFTSLGAALISWFVQSLYHD